MGDPERRRRPPPAGRIVRVGLATRPDRITRVGRIAQAGVVARVGAGETAGQLGDRRHAAAEVGGHPRGAAPAGVVRVEIVDIGGVTPGLQPEQQRVGDLSAGRRGHQPDAGAVVVETQPAGAQVERRALHDPVQRDAVRRQLAQVDGTAGDDDHRQVTDEHPLLTIPHRGAHCRTRHGTRRRRAVPVARVIRAAAHAPLPGRPARPAPSARPLPPPRILTDHGAGGGPDGWPHPGGRAPGRGSENNGWETTTWETTTWI
ncbi:MULTISPECIES: hypothetical protein [Protofrankia]|nr:MULTISPECIES: hypothetical protein [Protofrankia]